MFLRFALLFFLSLMAGISFADEKLDKQKELETLRTQIESLNKDKSAFEAEIRRLGQDRAKLTGEAIETAKRAREFEEKIAFSQKTILTLTSNEAKIKTSLATKHTLIADVLAALQRMGRNPTPALLTSPQDAMKAVRTALMVGAILPEMRQEVVALQNELGELMSVRQQSDKEQASWKKDVEFLANERNKLESLAEARIDMIKNVEKNLNVEKAKIQALAAKATSIESFLQSLEPKIETPAPVDKKAQLAALSNLGRLSPALPFQELQGKLNLPLQAKIIKEFGANIAFPSLDKGILLESVKKALVTSPADVTVMYAGNFRSYAQLLILNAGGGYTIIIGGLEKINVDVGQFVLSGEPIGMMGTSANLTALTQLKSDLPHLYFELKKDGISLNPASWFAKKQNEKV